MYTTQNNKQREIERQLDRLEEEVAKVDVYNLQKLDREIVRKTGGRGRQVQINAHNIEQ